MELIVTAGARESAFISSDQERMPKVAREGGDNRTLVKSERWMEECPGVAFVTLPKFRVTTTEKGTTQQKGRILFDVRQEMFVNLYGIMPRGLSKQVPRTNIKGRSRE